MLGWTFHLLVWLPAQIASSGLVMFESMIDSNEIPSGDNLLIF